MVIKQLVIQIIKLPHFPNILKSILNSFYFKIFEINFGFLAFIVESYQQNRQN